MEEFADRVERIRAKLYRIAMIYLNNEAMAVDALDEAVYKAFRAYKKLKQPEYFDTWLIRILINTCKDEIKRARRLTPIEEIKDRIELRAEQFDSLPLREAIQKLPEKIKEVIILRYFSGYTLIETAKILRIPQGTAATRQRKGLQLLRLELGEEEIK